MKKGSSGLGFENFSKRIGSLVNFDTFKNPSTDTKQVDRLTVIAGEMVKTTVMKYKFSQPNNKRVFFPNRIVSLPFHHPL